MATYGGVLNTLSHEGEYGFCEPCQKIYEIQLDSAKPVRCPLCKNVIKRGWTKQDACKMLDESQKELLQ